MKLFRNSGILVIDWIEFDFFYSTIFFQYQLQFN